MGHKMVCFAGIDVGSHTTRLLIVSVEKGIIKPLRNLRIITGMAKGFHNEGAFLPEEGKKKTADALKHYKDIMENYEIKCCKCGATGIFRKARDSETFLSEVRQVTGVECKILSEQEEALLSFKGTASFLKDHIKGKNVLVFDLGGSSVEFIFSEADEPIIWKSLSIGATTVTNLFLKKAPPDKEDIEKAFLYVDKKLKEELTEIKKLYEKEKESVLIGSAGTVSTLGAMKMQMTEYVPYKISGLSLDKRWISHVLKDILGKSLMERRQIPGLEKGREDIIAGGVLIVDRIVNFFGQDKLVVSDAGLLEGITLNAVSANTLQSNLTWQF